MDSKICGMRPSSEIKQTLEEEKAKASRAHIATGLKDRAALRDILKERFFIPCL